ncbi:IucA/IucC family protein [Yinghuangia seranimata]|uniref:IucA/IucC family protein n=1 Tax=Yinghuangia seranimata TaxID=408067 RepID=UPI00248B0FED|nr:IucA/IucC family protein [Yinghuangia seranimata]MDI2127201.1 IucA/IucC family protein [Yinghuangia seranimata]
MSLAAAAKNPPAHEPAPASAASTGNSTGTGTGTPTAPGADEVTSHTLLNCLLREVSGPEHQATVSNGKLLIRLPRAGALLGVDLRRTSLTGAHRFRGGVRRHSEDGWDPLGSDALAELISRELELRSGIGNDEFAGQVRSSRDTIGALTARRAGTTDPTDPTGTPHTHVIPGTPLVPDGPIPRYLDSERSLLFGHRFHPAPKAHSGSLADRVRFGPEGGGTVQAHLLAVRTDLVREEAVGPDALAPLDGLHPVPDGYRLLPVHPWQSALSASNPALRAALDDGRVLDLGVGGPHFTPTSSVRTLAGDGFFAKFSVDVRITNCVRKNAAYELSGAVALTRILAGPARATADRHPGFALLPEPAYRTVDLGVPTLFEGLGVIVRDAADLTKGPGTPLLAAAVADEYASSGAHVSRLVPDPTPERIAAWWEAYLRHLVPPVLTLFFEHGVVLEPHLQNVLVCVDDDGTPVRMLFRDLEGTKLLPERHSRALADLPGSVAAPIAYDAERGWNRVVYCLLVNHIGETLAALADLCPTAEPRLWALVRAVLLDHARTYGSPPPLRALLSGVPLPAKANLLTRWRLAADREAGYVPLPSPLGAAFLHGAEGAEPWAAR